MDDSEKYFKYTNISNNVKTKDLLLQKIQCIVEQLVQIYKTTDNLADQQYIFTKFKELLRIAKEERLEDIYVIVFQGITKITE